MSTAVMSSGAAAECLYLVDAHALIFQVFHAIRGMTTPSGLPANALFGFTRDLLFLRAQPDLTHLVCVFDVEGPTFREAIYPAYKANRGPMPDDLVVQLPLLHELLAGLRIPVLGVPGFEADDVIATVARAAAGRGMNVYICTSDKDCRQLLDDRIRMYSLRKRQPFGRAELVADWGVTPEQVIDLQTLVGDSVDNVPGVRGIGVATAAKLLKEYGTLENLLANVEKVRGPKLQQNLKAAVEQLPLSRKLVTLDTQVPVPMDWDAWRLREWDAPRLLELFRAWGFRGFAAQVREQGAESDEPAAAPVQQEAGGAATSQPKQGELFDAAEMFPFGANAAVEPLANGTPRDPAWKAKYHLVDTAARFAGFLRDLTSQRRFAIDLETTSLDPLQAEIVGIAFSWQEGEGWYLALRAPEGESTLCPAETLAQLKPLLEDPAIAKVNQNIKFDQLVLRQQGVTLRGVAGDSMVADYLLHAGERTHNLEELARRYLNHQVIPITDLIGKKGKAQLRMDQVSAVRVAEYSGEDADVAWRLCSRLEPELARQNLKTLYDDLEVPLIEVLADLEYTGIRLDVPRLRKLSDEMAKQLEAIEQEIETLAGRPFNIASPKQLREILFDEMKLPKFRKTGVTGEASTDQETLEKLAALGHALPRKILEHRQVAKLKGTYVDTLPDLVNPRTGRIHASFNQTVAATGRLSSSDPNLQNIPVRRAQGRQVRQAFLPEAGWTLLTADYSQIELRLLAHFSGDEALRRAFAEDRDIHAAVAAQVFGVTEAEVTGDQRRMAKTVNFGVIYGISAHGLAERLGISRDDGVRFIDAYFARYPRVQEYQARLLADCHRNGYVGTILGRRRRIEGVRASSTYQSRNQPEREAINMEIQGSAADLIKLAMLHLHRRLRREQRRSRMLLTVHDELVFEVPPEELVEMAALLREEMTTPRERELRLEVPLKVDLAVGPNWLDVEDWACEDRAVPAFV